jgi:hypothetical protein
MKVDAAITLAISLIQAGLKISQMVQDAVANGQAEVSDADWQIILEADAAARKHLQDAIDKG